MPVFTILKVADANDETIDKFVDRQRVGKTVTNLLPIEIGNPLWLQYIGGEKDGGIIQHSQIVRVERSVQGLKVYTKNTMVELRG